MLWQEEHTKRPAGFSPEHGSRRFSSSGHVCRLELRRRFNEDFRVKFEEWYSSVEIEGKASVDPYSEVLSQGSPATLLPADPVLSTPIAATSTGSAFRAAKAPFPSQRAAPYAAGFQVEQESEAAAGSRSVRECRRSAVAGCRRLSGSPSPRSTRVTVGPAEQDFELCTMAHFLRRVPLDELRGRGLVRGLQPEILEKISSWSSAHAHGDEICTQ